MKPPVFSAIESLESRIAPALIVLHPIPDIVPGIGQTGAALDLANAFDAAGNFRTHVLFTTNYIDPANPTVPQVIEIELFDDKAPVTVASFLRYVKGLAPSDFDGVFFHRLVPGFVLQGGGFAVDAPGSHIAIDPDVHNEFNASDAERSNLTGTIAMAKTGLGPHTATSEWFINLGNNAANLDNQNGGFTVFAKVTQGMNVVNAIAALTTQNLSSLNSALSSVPLQNYVADPDGNPATPPPPPTAAQFIAVTHAAVIAPTPANAAGISYAIASITDAATQASTDLVSGSVAGQALQLQYKAGASGVAKITVQASQAGEADVFEDFLVTLKPNLIASTTANPFATILVPGDKANVSVEIANSGAAVTSGNFDVTFYLSRIGGADAQGNLVEPGVDAVIGTIAGQALNLASGGKTTLNTEVTIPQKLLPVQAEYYRVIAQVTPSAGSGSGELFTDDNVTLNSPQHRLYNAFGSFAGRTNVAMTYVDAANHTVTATLTGGGYGQFDPNGVGSLGFLAIYSTTTASLLAINTGNAATPAELGSLYIDAAIGTASLGEVTVKGNFEAHAGLKTLTLGDLGDGTATHTLTIGAFAADPAQKATITLGRVRDIALNSSMPLGALQAVRWLDSDASHEVITAAAIDSVFLTGSATENGAFQANINVTGSTKLPSFEIAYIDPANQPATVLLTGGGYGHFSPQRSGPTGALEIFDTNPASTLSVTAGNATPLDSLYIDAAIGTAALGGVTLKGNFEAHAGIKTLLLGNVGDGTATRTLTIGAFASNPVQKATITLGLARDLALTSAMPVGALTAVDWLDSNASSELITASAIDSVYITGNSSHRGAFQADLTITGTTKLQSFIVTGTVSTARLQIAGDVGLIRLGALVRSEILVGVTSLPRTLAAFTGHNHRIDTFKILNSGAGGIPLIDSQIAAARFGSISVSKVAPTSGVARFGFIADRINSYLVGTKTALNLAAPMIFDQRTHYAVKIV